MGLEEEVKKIHAVKRVLWIAGIGTDDVCYVVASEIIHSLKEEGFDIVRSTDEG